ncbi:MAG: SRPBCC family protein [Actinobacteria bacterium]|jgi:Polyketide cyclase / dehydrase and lipid transport|nr:SRPBCC family protein [Actinomycetota bacterium]
MATIRSHARVHRTAEDVWKIVGDPTRIVEWFPGVTEATVEGNNRTLMLKAGLPVHEEIVTLDHRMRRFQYRITGPLPIKYHLGTMDVIEDGEPGCLLMYSTEISPDPMAFVLDGVISEGIGNLARMLNDHTEEQR